MCSRFSRIFSFCLIALLGLCSQQILFSQTTPSARPPDRDFENARNRWQIARVPDARTQSDTVTAEIRAERNAYWKKPLENLCARCKGVFAINVSGQDYVTGLPEFPDTPDSIWVIATFESFHVYAIDPDYELLYTEKNFRLDRVLRGIPNATIAEGSLIDVGGPGGQIIAPNGKVSSFQVRPLSWDFQIGHKYLVQFFYEPNGQFFSSGQEWDVTSGKVEPDIPPEKYRADHGQSAIDGMSLGEVEKRLPAILAEQANKKAVN